MGEQKVQERRDVDDLRLFTQKLLTDLEVLSRMIDGELFETRQRRIGAEQEMVLVDREGRPAPRAREVLASLDDPHFTHELALFNLECNLDPLVLESDCLSRFENQLLDLLGKACCAADAHDCGVVLTGILPTAEASDLTMDNVTPAPRYYALNEAILRLRQGPFDIRVKGFDELIMHAESVMFQSCTTSFQVHFEVIPEEFARLYNVAQAVAAPVLAAATNSPLVFGKRLWRETRIALFQQSMDTRQPTTHVREQIPRVSFGRRWVEESILEVLREDVARLRVLLSTQVAEDSMAELKAGRTPRLQALALFNGTVYRWNRPVYGVSDGKPHLRIENRILPSGPTLADEMANAAFWFGLMRGVSEEHGDISRVMSFESAEENFRASSRLGLQAQFTWPGRPSVPAKDLILQDLLPLARKGLDELGIVPADSDRYLGILEERVERLQTGSQWLIDSLTHMGEEGTKAERLAALTLATMERQATNEPVVRWRPASLAEAGGGERHYSKVRHFMATELFTVHEDEPVDLVAALMDWEHVCHVPVEDDRHRLVGLVAHWTLLRLLAQGQIVPNSPIPVSEVMRRDLVTVGPDTATLDAARLMKKHEIGCLPVVDHSHRLVGLITDRDFLDMAAQLLEAGLPTE